MDCRCRFARCSDRPHRTWSGEKLIVRGCAISFTIPPMPELMFMVADKRIRAEADPGSLRGTVKVAVADWAVCLKAAHPGYIGWEEFMANQRRLADNGQPLWGGTRRRATQGLGAAAGHRNLWLLRAPHELALLRAERRLSRLLLSIRSRSAWHRAVSGSPSHCRSTRLSSASCSMRLRRIRLRSRLQR